MKRPGPIQRKTPMPQRTAPLARTPFRRTPGPLSTEAAAESTAPRRSQSAPARGKRINAVNAQRRAAEFARCFGSDARVKWMKAKPCLVCGRTPSENAHTHTAGMSYRADVCHIVPLCADHHRTGPDSFHELGSANAFDARHGTDLFAAAARLAAEWDRRTRPR